MRIISFHLLKFLFLTPKNAGGWNPAMMLQVLRKQQLDNLRTRLLPMRNVLVTVDDPQTSLRTVLTKN